MIKIDIKVIAKPLDEAGISYETTVERIGDHKHIRIYKEGVIDRNFIKDSEHNWYEGHCDLCDLAPAVE